MDLLWEIQLANLPRGNLPGRFRFSTHVQQPEPGSLAPLRLRSGLPPRHGRSRFSPRVFLRQVSQSADFAAHRLCMNRRAQTVNAPAQQRVLIDIPELAARLAVSERFVRRLIAERRVPFFKVGKFIRFDSNDIDRWIETRRVV